MEFYRRCIVYYIFVVDFEEFGYVLDLGWSYGDREGADGGVDSGNCEVVWCQFEDV